MAKGQFESGSSAAKEAGRRGGAVRKAMLPPDGFAEMGRKGGEAARDRHGSELYSRIGKAGGDLILERYGPAHFSRLGKAKKGSGRSQEEVKPEGDAGKE